MSGDFGYGKDFTVQVAPGHPAPRDLDLSGATFRITQLPGEDTDTEETTDPETSEPIAFAPDDVPVSFDCTTDARGTCSFHTWSPMSFLDHGTVADPGRYVLTQVSSSPGLAANTGSRTFELCSFMGCSAGADDELGQVVGNDSLFRRTLVTTVTDLATGAPLACAGYELTGPDYPHLDPEAVQSAEETRVPAACATAAPSSPASPSPDTEAPSSSPSGPAADDTGSGTEESGTEDDGAGPGTDDTPTQELPTDPTPPTLDFAPDEDPVISFGTQISDEAGTLTFRGWFVPGTDYLLTPTATPAGYEADTTDSFGITTTAAEALAETPAAVARQLAPAGSGPLAPGAPDPTAPGRTDAAALATTGSPVGSLALVGGGLVALGGSALLAGTTLRRRARRSA